MMIRKSIYVPTFVLQLLQLLVCHFVFGQSKTAGIPHPPGQFYSIQGHKIWIETEGTGPALLLIQGGPGLPHDYLHPWFTAMAKNHRVIYYDPYGRGKSDHAANSKEYTFDRDVEEVEGIRTGLNLHDMAILGHSYGGMVALAYALKYPEEVTHLILVSTLPGAASWKQASDLSERELAIQFPETWAKVQSLRSRGVPNNQEMDEAIEAWHFTLRERLR